MNASDNFMTLKTAFSCELKCIHLLAKDRCSSIVVNGLPDISPDNNPIMAITFLDDCGDRKRLLIGHAGSGFDLAWSDGSIDSIERFAGSLDPDGSSSGNLPLAAAFDCTMLFMPVDPMVQIPFCLKHLAVAERISSNAIVAIFSSFQHEVKVAIAMGCHNECVLLMNDQAEVVLEQARQHAQAGTLRLHQHDYERASTDDDLVRRTEWFFR